MKTKLNNSKLNNHYNIRSVSQCLFVQKWNELFFPKTINTYQFKLRNSHYILKETLEVLNLVKIEGIPHANLNDLILECKKQITNDPIIKKSYREILGHLTNVLKTNVSSEHEILQLEYRLKNALKLLDINYKSKIIQELRIALDEDEKIGIENLTDILASELVNEGWSPKSLNLMFKKIFLSDSKDFFLKWDEFIDKVNGTKSTFNCYFKLDIHHFEEVEKEQYNRRLQSVGIQILLGSQILSTLNARNAHIKSDSYYIVETAESYLQDIYGAIDKCIQQIASKQAVLSYFDTKLLVVEGEVFILKPGAITVEKPNNPSKENSFNVEVNDEKIQAVEEIWGNEKFNLRDKKRLSNFFRQYGLSIDTVSPETKYSTLWSALESLLMTGHYGNIIDHVKKLIPTIMCSRYIRRLLKNFLYDCQRANVEVEINGEKIDIRENENDSIEKVWLLLITENENRTQFLGSLNDYTLLEQRAYSLIEDLKDSTSLERLLSNHHDTVSWHIQRLYRARNSLVHAATTNKDLDVLLDHLHFYIKSTVHELLFRIEQHGFLSLGELYIALEDNYIILVESLKIDKKTKEMYKFENVFNGPAFTNI